jgi:hypothetical protein
MTSDKPGSVARLTEPLHKENTAHTVTFSLASAIRASEARTPRLYDSTKLLRLSSIIRQFCSECSRSSSVALLSWDNVTSAPAP